MTQGAALPNFLIVGAMRSGTTSLFAGLRHHPQIFVPREKELRFFDVGFDLGLEWYRDRFAGSAGAIAVGEASQTYMYDEVAADRMAATVPDARLIAILRDPVERAYSHYWLNRARGREPLDFEAAIDAEDERIGRPPHEAERFFYSYVDRGRYFRQVERLSQSYDRSKIHVLLFDDLRDRPMDSFAGVCRFLGVDDRSGVGLPDTPINAFQGFRSLRVRGWTMKVHGLGSRRMASVLGVLNRRRASYPPMAVEARDRLADVFRDDNVALAGWLGRDLSSWTGMSRRTGIVR